jgi:hypothetical protein
MSSIRQKSPGVKGSSTPEGSLTPQRSLDVPQDDTSVESQQKQRRSGNSWFHRFNGTVFAVLLIFAFIYSTVTLCVVSARRLPCPLLSISCSFTLSSDHLINCVPEHPICSASQRSQVSCKCYTNLLAHHNCRFSIVSSNMPSLYP